MLNRRDSLGLTVGATLVLASLGVYSWTLAPTVTLIDSGELILAAYGVGVAHPPGFPLYLVLAHLATLRADRQHRGPSELRVGALRRACRRRDGADCRRGDGRAGAADSNQVAIDPGFSRARNALDESARQRH